MRDVTRIIESIKEGDSRASEQLLPLVYNELRRLAAHKLSNEKPGQTLQATALVHEAYMRLIGGDDVNWDSKGHFFAAAAESMRRLLVENARRKKALKRGGHLNKNSFNESDVTLDKSRNDLIALDEALNKLALKDPVKAKLVNLRFFAGLNNEQAANALGISQSSADRYWLYARSWLHLEICGENHGR